MTTALRTPETEAIRNARIAISKEVYKTKEVTLKENITLKETSTNQHGYTLAKGTRVKVCGVIAGENLTEAQTLKPDAHRRPSSGVFLLEYNNGNGFPIHAVLKLSNGSKYATGFIKATQNPAVLAKEVDAGISKSWLGNKVEPDGWDEHGFCSRLLTAGLI